ncbi:MAG: SlyX family protein, partial [Candidatus Thiodiazotropha sp.]
MMNDRIIDLESRMAFQEQAIHTLSETLIEQQRTIDSLNRAVEALARMFHPFLNLAGDMAKLGWFALTGNQTS